MALASGVTEPGDVLKVFADYVSGYAVEGGIDENGRHNFAISLAANQILDAEDNGVLLAALNAHTAPLRERVAELERELESIADFANGEGDVGNIIARRARAALSPGSQDGKKG